MSERLVLTETQDRILVITLNNPTERNGMSPDMLDALKTAFEDAARDEHARCVVITGRGDTFCGGADLRKGFQVPGHKLSNEASMAMYKPFLKVLEIKVPVIAAMQGHAIGGGLGLAMVADIRIANADARYGANFVKLGIHPGMATTFLLPRLVGMPKAAELLFTGRLVNGREAEALGLVNHAVPQSEVLDKSIALAREIVANAPVAVRWVKESLYRHADWNPVAVAQWEAHLQSRTVEMADAREGVAALLEKRPPSFSGQ